MVNWEAVTVPSEKESCGTVEEEIVSGKILDDVVPTARLPVVG